MTWKELQKMAVRAGWQFYKHGGKHDVYFKEDKKILIDRHWPQEVKSDFMNSYQEILESYTEMGEEIPEELRNPVFKYTYDISALFDAFKFLNASKFAESIGISPSLMRHYKSGDTYISAKQAKKIEAGLHRIARELLVVSL